MLVAASVVVAAPANEPITAECRLRLSLRRQLSRSQPEHLPRRMSAAAAAAAAEAAAEPDKLVVAGNPGAYFLDYNPLGEASVGSSLAKGAMPFYTWSELQPGPTSYNIGAIRAFASARAAENLKAGISLVPYNGVDEGDIKALPNWVIASNNTTVVITDPQTKFVYYMGSKTESGRPYFRNVENGDFDAGTFLWTLSGSTASVVPETDPKGRTAARLGGANNAVASLTHTAFDVPAMPPASEWPGGAKDGIGVRVLRRFD